MPQKAVLAFLLLLYLDSSTTAIMKVESMKQEPWRPTAAPKYNPKRSVSFPPFMKSESYSHSAPMGHNYVPMFIVRPISDEKMKNMFASQPVKSYSSHSPTWSEPGMDWKNPFKQPHHVVFKNPDLSKAPKVVRIFLPVQQPPVIYYTKYHDTFSKPVSPLHTSITASKEIGLKNVYPYNTKPPLIYQAPLKPVKPLPAPYDSHHFTSVSHNSIAPIVHHSSVGGKGAFGGKYMLKPSYSIPSHGILSQNYHGASLSGGHGLNHGSSHFGNHLGLGHFSTAHHLPGYHTTGHTMNHFAPSHFKSQPSVSHHFTKEELAAALQSSKHSFYPTTAAASVSPIVTPHDFHPIPAPQLYHRPKHPTLSPYHVSPAPHFSTHSPPLPVHDYLTPTGPHFIESHTATPTVQYYIPHEIDHSGRDGTAGEGHGAVEEEVLNYEPSLGNDDSDDHSSHTAHASISVHEGGDHDHEVSHSASGGDHTGHGSQQKGPHIQHHDHGVDRRHHAQAKAFGPQRFPLSLDQFSPLNPNVPPAYVKAPFLYNQNYQVLPLSHKNAQPQLKFLAEHGATHPQNLVRPNNAPSGVSTLLYPLPTSTPFPPGTGSDRSIRPVKEETVDHTSRDGSHGDNDGHDSNMEKGNVFISPSEHPLMPDSHMNGTAIGVKEMSAAIATTLRQEKCEEKCVIDSKIGEKGEPTCGSDGKIYTSKTQLLCAHKCGRRDLEPQPMKNCQSK